MNSQQKFDHAMSLEPFEKKQDIPVGYEADKDIVGVAGNDGTFEITNKMVPVSMKVTKAWQGDSESVRPAAVSVALYRKAEGGSSTLVDLQNLEYRGFDAAQFLFDEFTGNPHHKNRLIAEALLSLDIYFNQLTTQQQFYLLQNCKYHKDDRFMVEDLIG